MKLQLFYPVKPFFILQKFGETVNNTYYHNNGVNVAGHNGIDFMAKHNQPVYASHDGTAYSEVDDRQGYGVVVRTTQPFDYPEYGQPTYFKTIYWHFLPNIPVKDGQAVKAGDLLGYADSTGLSTGDHLHYGLKPVLLNEPPGIWYNIAQNNGYMGAIDPAPYFNGLFAQDINNKFIFIRNLYRGLYSEDVKELQIRLQMPLEFQTGFFGQKTFNAVMVYQTLNNISSTGFVGPLTRAKLNGS